jgi:murein DD-endopeptidase MepM/ murein hydrolase activator NlpD
MDQANAIAPLPSTTPAAPGAAAPQNQEKLRALAAQFESLLISQMLREMRATLFDDDEDTGFASGPLSDTLFTELSLALSRSGGLGFSKTVLDPLTRQAGEATGGSSADAALNVVHELRASGLPLATLNESGLPLAGRVTSGYGWRQDPLDGIRKFHKGTDIALPVGHGVPSARAGEVTFAGELSGYGLTVVVDHGGGIATRYAHLSEVNVKVGDTVQAGQDIARSGASGRATGPHLHFEVLEAGQPVDPRSVIKG